MVSIARTLYDTDYYRWMEETIERLRSRDYDAVDWENLIEELEGINSSDRHALENLLTQLYGHLLKILYWKSERAANIRQWRSEIVRFRFQIRNYLKESPSLTPYLTEISTECLEDARASMSYLFDIPIEIPITLDQALDEDWFPEIDGE